MPKKKKNVHRQQDVVVIKLMDVKTKNKQKKSFSGVHANLWFCTTEEKIRIKTLSNFCGSVTVRQYMCACSLKSACHLKNSS